MNLFQGLGPGYFDGVRIIEDINLTDTIEDWSDVRSPSRAKRRRARGYRQRIRLLQVPKPTAYFIDNGRTMIVHPEIRRKLSDEASKDTELRETEAFLRKEKPQPNPETPWGWRSSLGFMPMTPSIVNFDPTS